MKPIIYILLLLFPAAAYSQHAVKGRIVDGESGSPIQYATVTCYDDSGKASKAAVCGSDGKFSLIPGNRDKYMLVAGMMGYRSDTLHVAISSGPVDLGDIRLAPGVAIGEVEVTASRNLLEQLSDRYVYNVANDPDAKKLKMMEIMEKIPMLGFTSGTGKLTFMGTDIKEILIDGERHEMINAYLQFPMRLIRGDVMSQIEIIPPGSPEYNNERPIMNIKTARAIPNGFAVELSGNGNTENAWGANMNFISKIRDKVVVGFRYGMGYQDKPKLENNLLRETFADGEVIDIQNSTTTSDSRSSRHNFALRASTKVLGNNLRFGVQTSVSDSKNFSHINMIRTNGIGETVDAYTTDNTTRSRTEPRLNADAAYSHGLPNNYKADYGYSYMDNLSGSETSSGTFRSSDSPASERSSHSSTGSQEHLAKISVKPIIKGKITNRHSVNASLQYTHRKYYNSSGYTRWDPLSMSHVSENDYNNGLEYTQRIISAHARYLYYTPKISASAGISSVYENSGGVFRQMSDTKLRYDRVNLTPGASLNYRINKQYNVSVGYGMGIVRPDIDKMNPYVDKTDSMNRSTGNPLLTPERSHNFRFGTSYTFVPGRRMIWLECLYSDISNAVESVTSVDQISGIATTTYANIGRYNRFTAKLTLWGLIAKKWFFLNQITTYDYVEYKNSLHDKPNNYVHGVTASTNFWIKLWGIGPLYTTYDLRSDIGSQTSSVSYSHWFRFSYDQTLVKGKLFAAFFLENPFDSHRYVSRYIAGNNFRMTTRNERRGRIFGFSIRGNFGRLRDRIAESENLNDDRMRESIPDRF